MTDADADPLLELFRQETRAAAVVLTEGLAVLAVDPDHPTDWEPLERAARSVRGAALIVGKAEAAELAGAIGDVFADARQDARTVTADRVAALLGAVDVLKETADGEATGQVAEATARLRGGVGRVESSRPDVLSPSPPRGEGRKRPRCWNSSARRSVPSPARSAPASWSWKPTRPTRGGSSR